jgi:hypothetical protein
MDQVVADRRAGSSKKCRGNPWDGQELEKKEGKVVVTFPPADVATG